MNKALDPSYHLYLVLLPDMTDIENINGNSYCHENIGSAPTAEETPARLSSLSLSVAISNVFNSLELFV
jgi:hypothetical protein